MRYFSVPANFNKETIDKLSQLNEIYSNSKVIETYGQITEGSIISSGRETDVLPTINYEELNKYVRYSMDKGISFNYTLNAACLGNKEFSQEGINELKKLLKNIKNIGITNLTVASPPIMELVKSLQFDFKIKASAICEITSPSKALFYKRNGIERAVIDPDITRDFKTIKNISKVFGNGLEIIVNNVCYKNCAYKMYHYNHEAHCCSSNTSQVIKDYYFNRCSLQKAGGVKNSMRLNWIRPEDLKYYENSGIKYFKIQGRQNVLRGDIVKTVEAYFKEDFDGNLFDLITLFAPYNAFQPYMDNKKLDGFVKGFYDHPGLCSDVCEKCNYCDKYASKCMDKEIVKGINKQAIDFYWEYDKYKNYIEKDCEDSKSIKRKIKKSYDDLKFDFE
ncbi:U32 family peptidase [Clostridium estertheticum]|uniref:U32 family peptidase n=1 Tax=Clostridium estertheticum TaxID=238834 RepID=UPI001C0D499C|nr:U32 family peptidase [Clostridium estertheticum]MBU3198528.1 U32 family peptidase [Clostridium estertheticum]WAG64509.1 U32 family peptidase [Clostridium estertheticum]